jgi:hypothetical protein
MKEYIITEEQKNAVVAQLGELPIKYSNLLSGVFALLSKLPEVKADKPIEEPK